MKIQCERKCKVFLSNETLKRLASELNFNIDEETKTVSAKFGRKYDWDKLNGERLRVKKYEVVIALADLFGIQHEALKVEEDVYAHKV